MKVTIVNSINSIEDVPRVSSSEMARRPGQLMKDVLRHNVIIIQNRGHDVAALMDIEEYERLITLIDQLRLG